MAASLMLNEAGLYNDVVVETLIVPACGQTAGGQLLSQLKS